VTIACGHDLFETAVPVFPDHAGRDGGRGILSDRLLIAAAERAPV
jgi:hypothetical protein